MVTKGLLALSYVTLPVDTDCEHELLLCFALLLSTGGA